MSAYYFLDKNLEQAGAALGLSKSWASRIHSRALERIKAILGEDDEERHPR
jgi:RNA polymerase sigma factor for flagellar operon FliA